MQYTILNYETVVKIVFCGVIIGTKASISMVQRILRKWNGSFAI